MTLTEFLLARIAEDEAEARSFDEELAREFGAPAASSLSSKLTSAGSGHMDYPVLTIDGTRVLAECEAKRRIVALHVEGKPGRHPAFCRTCDGLQGWPCATLKLLALPYSDHPDYDKKWKP